MSENPLFGIFFAIAYLSFCIAWVMFATKRLRPWIRQKLGEAIGFKIVERYRFRSQTWEISQPHTRTQGCLVSLTQFFADFGCMVGPIFLALAIMGIVMFALSGG